jgi:hypothetical protein
MQGAIGQFHESIEDGKVIDPYIVLPKHCVKKEVLCTGIEQESVIPHPFI